MLFVVNHLLTKRSRNKRHHVSSLLRNRVVLTLKIVNENLTLSRELHTYKKKKRHLDVFLVLCNMKLIYLGAFESIAELSGEASEHVFVSS